MGKGKGVLLMMVEDVVGDMKACVEKICSMITASSRKIYWAMMDIVFCQYCLFFATLTSIVWRCK